MTEGHDAGGIPETVGERDGGAHVLIVGANIAGLSAAQTLRQHGYQGRITLLGAEPELPYERPPLSKAVLLGAQPPESVTLHPASYYADEGIALRLGMTAAALDTDARTVTLADGSTIPFDTLLIATGSEARTLPVPGASLPGIYTLRTLAEARALLAALAPPTGDPLPSVVVVGGGFIGAEVAADLRERSYAVTVIEVLPHLLQRALGPKVGFILDDIHRAHGVDLRLETGVVAFEGGDKVEAVVTSTGDRLPAEVVLVAVGTRAADGWLAGSGLRREDGVVVDASCATGVPGIYAAGDVARWPYQPAGASEPSLVRLEHWDNALRQGEAAARTILGEHVAYNAVPYFWSDQYDLKLQMVGYAPTWERVVLRGDPASGSFGAGYFAGGRLRAALAANRTREFMPLKRLVGAGAELDPATFANPAFDLRALANKLPRG